MNVVENILGRKKKYDEAGNIIVPKISREEQSELDMLRTYEFQKKQEKTSKRRNI